MVAVIKQIDDSAPVEVKADENVEVEVTAKADDASEEVSETDKQEQPGAADAEGPARAPRSGKSLQLWIARHRASVES